MTTRREGLQILMATMLGDSMDRDVPDAPLPPDTLGIRLSTTTKRLRVHGDGRTATISVKQLMDALGGR
ncbi:MAG TPA: hypothetical protein DEQ40_19150 [Oxalobacteraceae bacterium]|jgi:hypothetical protein|nr:hypothetical protein [Oxalobacteraceae bacterium]